MPTLVAAATITCAGPSGVTTPDSGIGESAMTLEKRSPANTPRGARLPQALDVALGREHFAAGLYQAVVEVLGAERPFSNVVLAEARHVAALQKLYDKRNLTPPTPPGGNDIRAIAEGFLDIPEACSYAVELEMQIAAGYASLLATEPPADVARVLGHLKAATLDNHVVAFEGCAGS